MKLERMKLESLSRSWKNFELPFPPSCIPFEHICNGFISYNRTNKTVSLILPVLIKLLLFSIGTNKLIPFQYIKSNNLCISLNVDIRFASLCGVKFVFKQERRGTEGAAKVRIERFLQFLIYTRTARITDMKQLFTWFAGP